MAIQVFISHTTRDREDTRFAHRLAGDLETLGVRVWIAPESIRPGEDWVDAISRGLRESSHLVVVLTPEAMKSRWVKTETNNAIRRQHDGLMQVIPLNVKPCEPPEVWKGYHWVSFRRRYESGFRQLAEMLVGVPSVPVPSVERPPRYVPPPVISPGPTIMAQFRVLLADLAGLDPASIRPQSRLAEDLDLDELDIVELAMAAEEEWDVEISDEEIFELRTVRDWVNYLTRRAG